jgi:hypothetical protein
MREGKVIRRHAVGGGDGAQRADMVVGPPVAHDADGRHRQQHGEGLPDGVIESGGLDLVQIDRIGLAQDGQHLPRDLAGHPHAAICATLRAEDDLAHGSPRYGLISGSTNRARLRSDSCQPR